MIDWLFELVTSLFVVALEDETVLDIDICVITVEVNSLLVAIEECVNNAVSDMIVDDIDGYIEPLTVIIGWTDEVSKIDVIRFEVWSEIDDDVAVLVVVICVDDNDGKDELSIELETPLIFVVTDSVSGEDVAVLNEVAYECAIVDNDKYSTAFDVCSTVRNVVSLVVFEIPIFVVEINGVVDSCDSMDEVWSLWELNGVVNTEVSDEIDALFNLVTVTVDNWFVCSVEESVW